MYIILYRDLSIRNARWRPHLTLYKDAAAAKAAAEKVKANAIYATDVRYHYLGEPEDWRLVP